MIANRAPQPGSSASADPPPAAAPAASVSVIIPCYNYAHYLRCCVESVLSQPRVEVSVLIVDDASQDDSGAVAAELAAADRRVEVLRHSTNRGHIGTYNEGLEWARADYTVLLSADDLLVPGSLGRATRLLEAHPEVGFAYGRSRFFTSNDQLPAPRLGPERWEIWPGRRWVEKRCLAGSNSISSPEVVVRTALYKELGGYRADLPHTGDLEMWMRFAAHADVGYIAGADQAYYRVHPKSMQRNWLQAPTMEVRQRATAFRTFFETSGRRLADHDQLWEVAARALAREALWRACRTYDRGLDPALAEDLAGFAIEVYPAARSLPEHRGLRWRRRLGRRWAPLAQPLALPWLVRQRVRSQLWWWRWNRHGV